MHRSEITVWRITAADVDNILGREATEQELQDVAKTLDWQVDVGVIEDAFA